MIWTSKLVLKKIITVYQNKVASTVMTVDPIGAQPLILVLLLYPK
jgi:hypothetical protein